LSKESFVSVVDDDHSFRDSMQRLLKSRGYAVAVFPSAAEFLTSPKRDATACLVVDVQMPAMTGIELYKHLVDVGRVIPTILVTAYPDDSVRGQMRALGVQCYLRKPLEETELIDCIRSAFASGRAPRTTQ